jgi:hypothetical protein
MSIYRQLVRRFWPRNTLGVAYLQWQAQESRLVEARQRLAGDYQAVCRQAEQVQVDTHQGVLRAARLRLDQPLDPMILKIKERLARLFALRGKGFFRRVPSPLEVELSHYLASNEKICRSHGELGARMRWAQKIITIFVRNPEFCSPHYFRLALISPESACLLFHLRQNRLKDRQAIQDYLSKAPRVEQPCPT